MYIPRSELPTAALPPVERARTADEILAEPKVDARMRAEISRRFRRPKSQRMLKLAKQAQDRGDNEVAEMWVRKALR